MSDRLDAAVLGAGPAGLSAAYVLALRKANAVLFEADDVVGGLARTVEHEGSRFDLGGHRFFTRLPQVERLWLDLLDADLLVRPRLSRIYYQNRYFTYPLQAKEIIGRLGLGEATLCAISYLASAARPSRSSGSFEEWVTNRFGKRLYNAFFRGYTEKVWGIPGSEIRSEWAAQRIKNFSFPKALMSSLRIGHEPVTSLIEEFHYPRLGPGQLWEALADRVRDGGVPITFGARAVQVRHDGSRVQSIVVRQDGRESVHPIGALLSSIPLGELALSLDPAVPDEVRAAAGRLRYRSLVVVALVTSEPQPFPDNWIYLQDPGTRAGRVQNYGAWSEAMVQPHTTCLGVEYFCFEGDPIWEMGPEEAIELAKSELASIGLIDPSRVIGGTKVNVPKAYPMYDREYADAVAVIRAHLAGLENLQTFGRNGLHRYNNQDHSMWTGALAALNVLEGTDYDVWSVNTDQAYHEERGAPVEGPVLDPFRSE